MLDQHVKRRTSIEMPAGAQATLDGGVVNVAKHSKMSYSIGSTNRGSEVVPREQFIPNSETVLSQYKNDCTLGR